MGFLDDLGLLARHVPGDARNALKGLLGDMPLTKALRGESEVSANGLKNALMGMPVGPDAQGSYDAAMQIGPQAMGGLLGKIVYHGSPHKFDKFDASKIGTGEGAQAYGHGVYLAEAPDVAEGYAKNLSTKRTFVDGKPVDLSMGDDRFAAAMSIAAQGYKKYTDDTLSAIKSGIISKSDGEKLLKDAAEFKDSKFHVESTGQTYKADLPDEWIPKMLDWDKPLSQQSPEVQRVIDAHIGKVVSFDPINNTTFRMNFSGSPIGGYWGDKNKAIQEAKKYITGKQFYEAVGKLDNISYPDSAAFLKEQDIPGIRYLDGGSRGKGQGSYNYVVFPGLEDKVKILERNGVPLSGLLGQ